MQFDTARGLGPRASAIASKLQIFRPQARVLGYACQHARSEFFTIVEGEHEIGPPLTRQGAVRAGLSLELPAEPEQDCEYTLGLRGRPLAHAAAGREMLISMG